MTIVHLSGDLGWNRKHDKLFLKPKIIAFMSIGLIKNESLPYL